MTLRATPPCTYIYKYHVRFTDTCRATHSPPTQRLSALRDFGPPHLCRPSRRPHTSMGALPRLPMYSEVSTVCGLERRWVANGSTLNDLAQARPGHVTTLGATPPCTYIYKYHVRFTDACRATHSPPTQRLSALRDFGPPHLRRPSRRPHTSMGTLPRPPVY
jgi:hypothetical protein